MWPDRNNWASEEKTGDYSDTAIQGILANWLDGIAELSEVNGIKAEVNRQVPNPTPLQYNPHLEETLSCLCPERIYNFHEVIR